MKRLLIFSTIFSMIMLFQVVESQDSKKSQIVQFETNIKANSRTTISLVGSDSINYILFDNLLGEDRIIIFMCQPEYYNSAETQKEKIMIPFPLLNPGKYTLEYVSQDTSFNFDFFYIP
jgi:hypothetical protein